jgi:integrase/recombinase XerD
MTELSVSPKFLPLRCLAVLCDFRQTKTKKSDQYQYRKRSITMAYIKLYCKKSKKKPNGLAPIYYVIRIDGKEKLIASGKFIAPDEFDNKAEAPKNNKKLQIVLNREKEKFSKIILDLEEEGRPVTFDYVIERYNLGQKDNFIEFCEKELKNMKGMIKPKTYADYADSIKVLKAYRTDIRINEITFDFLKDFEVWLTRIRKRSKNSRAHDFTMIRKFQNIAVRKGLSKVYAFRQFRIQREQGTKEFNDEKELQALIDLYRKKTLAVKLQRTLANYIFTCHTGVAGDDMRNKDRFQISDNCMYFRRGKTDRPVVIPLPRVALEMWEEIKDRNLKKKIYQVNEDLRDIMKIAEIKKDITYHCGRHTFAVLSLMKGLSIHVISKVLGHTTIKTTEIYAKVVNDLIAREMKLWDTDQKNGEAEASPFLPKGNDQFT